MDIRVPEPNKQPGICYAVGNDGIELPVIDITHPAFAFSVSDEHLSTLIDNMQRASSLPPGAMQAAATKSILVRGMLESADTYTTGMMTYLNKLEPANLGDAWATPVDRQWAASLTPTTFRWRMRDVARIVADGLAASATARPGVALHLINIGGGPAPDSWNALILVNKEHPDLLAGRKITIHALDLDAEGPAFGARAVASLCAESGPLAGLDVNFDYLAYDWNEPSGLRSLLASLPPDSAMAGSTEGGLFEFASDAAIVANLKVLHTETPADFVMAGPVVRDAGTLCPRLKATEDLPGRPAVRYIGLEKFGELAAEAGWRIERSLDGPMHQVVQLTKD
ncbi:MAG: hypothetical protein IPK16_29805 [Anaerolineales bacterium]|nr:hypothetical protein [Anaerolineales bacterium]